MVVEAATTDRLVGGNFADGSVLMVVFVTEGRCFFDGGCLSDDDVLDDFRLDLIGGLLDSAFDGIRAFAGCINDDIVLVVDVVTMATAADDFCVCFPFCCFVLVVTFVLSLGLLRVMVTYAVPF